jgi:hypothetical protein
MEPQGVDRARASGRPVLESRGAWRVGCRTPHAHECVHLSCPPIGVGRARRDLGDSGQVRVRQLQRLRHRQPPTPMAPGHLPSQIHQWILNYPGLVS